MRRLLPLLAVFVVLGACSTLPDHVGPERLYWRAPILLPGVGPDQRQAGFWISRLGDPDGLVMTPAQIQRFNDDLRARKLLATLPLPDDQIAVSARTSLAKDFAWLSHRTLFLPDGQKPSADWWKAMRPRLDLDGTDSEAERYALTVAWADQRLLPDRTRLTAEVLDSEFDEFQNSGYDVGTPFQVRHTSADGRWYWARGTQSDGWFEAPTLAFCDRATFEAWLARDTVVATAPRAAVWLDAGHRVWKTWLRMGARLPVEADEGDSWRVSLPTADAQGNLVVVSAWIAKGQAVKGSLPYTRRTVLDQAFQLLDRPYGWGDSFGEQDCSRFLAEIYGTVGLTLPRNSAAEGQSGLDAGTFARKDPSDAKLAAVLAADPATTVLRLDGHIMLYLGTIEGTPYVVHCLWAYTQMDGTKEVIRVIDGAAVSTLFLSQGSQRGSLLERIRNIRKYQAPPEN